MLNCGAFINNQYLYIIHSISAVVLKIKVSFILQTIQIYIILNITILLLPRKIMSTVLHFKLILFCKYNIDIFSSVCLEFGLQLLHSTI